MAAHAQQSERVPTPFASAQTDLELEEAKRRSIKESFTKNAQQVVVVEESEDDDEEEEEQESEEEEEEDEEDDDDDESEEEETVRIPDDPRNEPDAIPTIISKCVLSIKIRRLKCLVLSSCTLYPVFRSS